MKSKLIKERIFLECDCYSPQHLMVVDLVEEEDGLETYGTDGKFYWLAEIGFMLNYKESWYKRIWLAIKYVLFGDGMYISNTVSFSERNIDQLQELVDMFRDQMERLKDLTVAKG